MEGEREGGKEGGGGNRQKTVRGLACAISPVLAQGTTSVQGCKISA